MWFPVTLWTVFLVSLLACSATASHNSFSDYEATPYKAASRSIALNLNPWPESDTFSSRQSLGDRSLDLDESLFNHGSDYPLDEEADSPPPTKRDSHSLSIVNPLDVLRQRLMLEMARRRMKDTQDQIRENEVILKNLGKRSEGGPNRTKRNRRIHVSNSESYEV